MPKTQIFVISSHLMFGQGLESLLRQEAKFEIVGQETDVDRALEKIKALQPEVIILDSDNSSLAVTTVLAASPGVKVISLSLQNNDLYVYQARQRVTRDVEDLFEAIEEDVAAAKRVTARQQVINDQDE